MSEEKRCVVCGAEISEKRRKRHPGGGCCPPVRTCGIHAGKMQYMGKERPPAKYKTVHVPVDKKRHNFTQRRRWIQE